MHNSWIAIDSENTIWNKGDPYDQRNVNVCWSWKTPEEDGVWWPEEGVDLFLNRVRNTKTIVGFNLAYDLAWLWKLGYVAPAAQRFFCCQVAEYILDNQKTPYPSLDRVAQKYLNQQKLAVVEDEYWGKGINTDAIPRPVLAEYTLQDIRITAGVYLKQLELIPASKKTLISLAMQDMVVLADMRRNGMKFDFNHARRESEKITAEISEIKCKLDLLHTVPSFNWASNDHLSSLFYGGTIVTDERVPVGVYKSGAKVGQIRYKVEKKEHTLPRIFKPLRGTELKKAGYWSTDDDTLKKLRGGNRDLLEGVKRIRELSKLQGTYFDGLPNLAKEHNWPEGYIHGQFNQVVTRTGRLSSTKPNLQNNPEVADRCFISRYE